LQIIGHNRSQTTALQQKGSDEWHRKMAVGEREDLKPASVAVRIRVLLTAFPQEPEWCSEGSSMGYQAAQMGCGRSSFRPGSKGSRLSESK